MDATTNFEGQFSEEEIFGNTDLSLSGTDGPNYPGLLDFCPYSYTPDVTTVMQAQGRIYMDQMIPGPPFPSGVIQEGLGFSMPEDLYLVPETMTNYDGTSSGLSPSVSVEYLETASYQLSPSFLLGEKESLPSKDLFDTVEQPTGEVDSSPNLPNMPRMILPRPSEQAPTSPEIGHKHQDGKSKKRQNGTPKKNRKKKRTAPQSHQCHFSGVTFPSKKSLDRHHVVWHKDYAISIGLEVGPFACPSRGCTKTFTRADNVTRHLNDAHGRMRR